MFTHTFQQSIIFFALIIVLFATSCNLFKSSADDEIPKNKQIARVYSTYLYSDDLKKDIGLPNLSGNDSIAKTTSYIDRWIRRQLLIHEAESKINLKKHNIESKILDYRYQLITYQYQLNYINEHIDKNVTYEEIKSYYNSNLDNFPLKQNIIKGKFIKITKNYTKLWYIKKLLKSSKEQDQKLLQEYCFENASNFTLADTIWTNYDDLVQGTPFAEISTTNVFFMKEKFLETTDENYKYFLKITEYKKTDDVAPLSIVESQIVDIIINKRKINLVKKLENKMYDEARKKHLFEIYN